MGASSSNPMVKPVSKTKTSEGFPGRGREEKKRKKNVKNKLINSAEDTPESRVGK